MTLFNFQSIRFDPKNNALDFLRLFLSLAVVYAHSWHGKESELGWQNPVIVGRSDMYRDIIPLGQLVVYGFFIISGFLITASWVRSPKITDYLSKRFLRIYPAFFVCIVMSSFFFIPVVYLLQKNTLNGFGSKYFVESFHYVIDNMQITMNRNLGYNELFVGKSMKETNGPLWSLIFEVKAYLLIVILGLIGVFKRSFFILIPTLLTWLIYSFAVYHPNFQSILNSAFGDYKIFPLFTYFLVGSVFYIFEKKIIWDWKIAFGFLIILMTSTFYDYFSLIAPICMTYLIIFISMIIPIRNLSKKIGDLSYGVYIYSWPIQLCLNAIDFNARFGFFTYFLVSAVLSLFAGFVSWNLVEKRFLALKS